MGLARSGSAAVVALAGEGREVIGVDAGAPAEAQALAASGIELHLGERGEELLARVGLVVKSPGVARQAPPIAAALERGLPVLGELELGWRMLANEFIAVTGTNGKTTTVELIAHIHREAGASVAVAGNVGTPVSSLVGSVHPRATIACEASSFQLEDVISFAPEAAVLLNIAPDHLDRHATLEAYTQAKLQIFARQVNEDVAVAPRGLGIEDLGGCARRVCFGTGPGVALARRARRLWWQERPLLGVEEIRLRGAHNVENAMAAAAVCLARGLDVDAVCAGLRSFAGVAHRLEEVASSRGVLYVNDSKATNVASTLVALAALADGAGIHLILGGQAKGQDFGALLAPVASGCRAAYLIGEDAPLIARALQRSGVPLRDSGDLEQAVREAAGAARPGEVVLLSPACASFDQFRDYEDRGERFRELAADVA